MISKVRPNLHFCIVEGRTIFMDEKSSRYFCLPIRIDESFQRSVSTDGLLESIDPALLVELADLDLIERPCGATSNPRHPISEPRKDLGQVALISPMLHEVIGTIYARLRSHIIVGFRDIQHIHAELDRERLKYASRLRSRSDAYPKAISRAFEQSDIVFGRSDRCLPRSVALVRRCVRAGFDPRLIFGVRVNPFAAHCWVQYDDTIVGDSLDVVGIYTPICAL